MTDSSLSRSNARVREAVDAVYRLFAAAPPAKIKGCPCCIGTRNTDVLLTTPLRDIAGQDLWPYVSGVYYTIGSDEDFRYLLPRILDISVNDPNNANDPEITLNKLGLAGWDSWAADEKRAISEFLDAWFEQALLKDISEVENGPVGQYAESVLCGAVRAGYPVMDWLVRLTQPLARPVLLDLQQRFPDKLSPFWEEAPEGRKELSLILSQGQA